MDGALLNRLLAPLKNKIFLLIGRAVLKAVKASEGTMRVQVSGLKDETITDMEYVQNYGFTCYPKVGSAETVNLFVNGSRDNGVTIIVNDREYRPTDLAEGEVCVYDHNGSRITLKTDKSIIIKSGKEVHVTAGGTLEFAVLASKLKTEIDGLIDALNGHVHTSAAPGAPTSAPTVPLIKPIQTAYSSTEVKVS